MTDLFSGLTQEIISGIALGSIYALIALGFTMIFKATEVVNFAQGELMMVGAYVNFFFVTTFLSTTGNPTAWTFLVALGGSMIFSVLFGYILDFIINKPLKDEPIFSIIMATLSLAIILRAVVAIIAGPISLMPFSPFGDSAMSPSGSGKTTLLNCISGLDVPTAGEYLFDRIPVTGNSEDLTTFRRKNVGYVFQFFNLLQDLTVLENVLLIQELSGQRNAERAKEVLRLVGLDSEIDRFPSEISGGQQQRVAIARSIAKNPKLLLGDELTGNLDTETSAKVMDVLTEACKSEGITTVMVTHDESLAKYATRVVRLDSGKIQSDEKVN